MLRLGTPGAAGPSTAPGAAGRALGLAIDAGRPSPLYQQVFDEIAGRIRNGAFPPGFRLPATRELARELRVHRNTLVRVYEDLEHAGLVSSRVGSGTFVLAPPRPEAELDTHAPRGLVATRRPEPSSNREAPILASSDLVDLATAGVANLVDAHADLRRCTEQVFRRMGAAALVDPPAEGVGELRERIAEELGRRGLPASADAIVVTGGTEETLLLLARSVARPGETVLVPSDLRAGERAALAMAGVRATRAPRDGHGPRPGALRRSERSAVRAWLLRAGSSDGDGLERRRELVAWARRARVVLVEDGSFGAVEATGPQLPALRALDGSALFVASFADLIPALRVGFVVAPAAIRDTLVRAKAGFGAGPSALLQHVLARLLDRGCLRAHSDALRAESRARRATLEAALAGDLPAGYRLVPAAGPFFEIALPPVVPAALARRAASRAGVRVAEGAAQTLRISWRAEPAPRLEDGARRLCRALAALAATGPGAPACGAAAAL